MGPKSNDRCPYKRHTGERHTERRDKGHVNVAAEIRVTNQGMPAVTGCWKRQGGILF